METTPLEARRRSQVELAMRALVSPGSGHISHKQALHAVLGLPGAFLFELRSLPLGELGQRLMALRYFIRNGRGWLSCFSWEAELAGRDAEAPARVHALAQNIEAVASDLPSEPELDRELAGADLVTLASQLEADAGQSPAGLRLLVALERHRGLNVALRERLRQHAFELHRDNPRSCDLIYLALQDLSQFPATTVGDGALRFIIVADKGEMGVRAVRETIAYGATPVVLYSRKDDSGSLQVRLAKKHGGFGIALEGSFRETYANYVQIAQKIRESYDGRFGAEAEEMLACSALYPGYGPLAENAGAIAHFRRSGIVFIGPMQDVVEQAGDKRKFRLLARAIDERSITPGIVIDDGDADSVIAAVRAGYEEQRFQFPGRLKAANGGGGRGQAIIDSIRGLPGAVHKVLGEINANGWGAGVMFEQNIPETIHLEVQVLRDRFGNTRHFGMRDCSEQRASQKVQEEAPPALLRDVPELEERICAIAVKIADEVGYVGACTVELMFKDGHFYLLEMNTRIQVEHPVSEAAHRIRTGDTMEPLNLVALQYRIAAGAPIPFAQEDVVSTHVAREFRINAEAWRSNLKDSRDGRMGMFLPNGGVFDAIDVPEADEIMVALRAEGIVGIRDLQVRFDCGFEAGDKLVNKDPTFGKLIVAVAPEPGFSEQAYELLRRASIEVLKRMRIVGRQVDPSGRVLPGSVFATNLTDHIRILESDCMIRHARGDAEGRHVNWVIEMFRRS